MKKKILFLTFTAFIFCASSVSVQTAHANTHVEAAVQGFKQGANHALNEAKAALYQAHHTLSKVQAHLANSVDAAQERLNNHAKGGRDAFLEHTNHAINKAKEVADKELQHVQNTSHRVYNTVKNWFD